ncbi:deaminase, partial [Paraliomyxa miuraensis]|uniref:deaminase n=1 Tax=Paraliomyxa miuraensis TaxID=376150 RepID=UPI00224D8765
SRSTGSRKKVSCCYMAILLLQASWRTQKVRKTLHLSDFFVANDNQSEKMLGDELWRFLQAVTGQEIVRPHQDEKGMQAAWSAALRSSCMSRQVGAAIVSKQGELLSVGTNDPPSPKGGLYADGGEPDHRCFKWPSDDPHCRNDRKKKEIYQEIFEKLQSTKITPKNIDQEVEAPLLAPAASIEDLVKALKSTRIRDLIEFSRAIHAEMDALLAIAREGTAKSEGATLYCTTYPCHSCARHIVAAGINEVVYIEPYDKSLANELHSDAVRDVSVVDQPVDRKNDPRVVFRLFGGVAPRRFTALFEKRRDLKDGDGLRVDLAHRVAHTDPILKGSFLTLEDDVAASVAEALEGGSHA